MSRIPDEFPDMGALFKKPYTEFEFGGRVYKVHETVGGHNGVAQKACMANPPTYDPERGRWVVHVTNNLIHIDYSTQRAMADAVGGDSPLANLVIENDPDPSRPSGGVLVSETSDPERPPEYPVDCIFEMHLRATAPGLPVLVTREPLELFADALMEWPPPVGTAYENRSGADFYLRDAPDDAEPIARILPGDSTVLTDVFVV